MADGVVLGDDDEDVAGTERDGGFGEGDSAGGGGADGDDGDAEAAGELDLAEGLADEGCRDFDFGYADIGAEGHFAANILMDQLIGEAFAELAFRVDDEVGADEGEDAGVDIVIGPGDDSAGAHLAEESGADDGGFAVFVADGAEAEIAEFGGGAGEGFGVGGVEAGGFGDEGGGDADEFFADIDGEDFDAAFGEGAGDGHAELAEADDDGLTLHGEFFGVSRLRSPLRVV